MAKGFGKPQQQEDIRVESMVSGRNGDPKVLLKWGKNEGWLTPAEAREHAVGILTTAAAAEIDAVVVKWAQQHLGISLNEAAQLRRIFRESRATNELPSCTMNFDGDRVTPDEARQFALDMLFMAFNTEMEAFLSHFLITDVGADESQVNAVVDTLRQMRGLRRVDELMDEEGDRNG
jgi:hypothetical protein